MAVKLVNQTVVKAADPDIQPYNLSLSGFDCLAVGMPITIFYAYHTPSARDLSSIFSTIKSSLAEALNHFDPFAGQVSNHPETGEPFIQCNNTGVKLTEASAKVPLANVYRPVGVDAKFPLNVQLTSYTCGSFSIAWTFDHALADAYGFVRFLSSWCAVANGMKPSETISHDRLVLGSRPSPTCDERIERLYTVCSSSNVFDDSPIYATEHHLYLVKGSSLESLVAITSEGGPRRTRTEALSAYLWKLMATSINDNDARCKMSWTVDGRRRLGKDAEFSDFIGNLVSSAVTEEERIRDLKEGTLSHVAGMVSRAIGEVANEDHFLDCIDWLDRHRLEKVVPRVVLGGPAGTILVSSYHNLPVMSMDFGFGLPWLATFSMPHDRVGNGFVNMVSAGRGDGSWFVYAFVWPELAAAIELDPDHVFEPFMKII